MESLPDAVFVVDVGHEEIAVREAIKLGIPIVAVVDTNSSPDEIDYVVPGNDDAMGAIRLYAHGAAEAVLEGKSSIPDVPVGDDEFVELDAEGKPKVAGGRRPGRGGVRKRPARKAVVRKKQSKLSAVRDAAAEEAPVPGPAATVAAPSDEAAKAEPPAEATEAPEAASSTEESAPADASGTDTPDAVKAAEAEAADPEVTEAADVDAEVAEPDGNDAGESDASGAEPAGEEMAGDEAGTDSAPEPDAEKAAEPDDGQAV